MARAMPGWDDESWFPSERYGHEVPDDVWAEYQRVRERVEELEIVMDGCPFVDDRPPLTPEQLRWMRGMMPSFIPMRNRMPRQGPVHVAPVAAGFIPYDLLPPGDTGE